MPVCRRHAQAKSAPAGRPHGLRRCTAFRRRDVQQGFSLIEVSIVTAIVLLIAIVGIPAIGSYIVENKVPKVGEELQRFVARAKANGQGSGVAPYRNLHDGVLANALRDSSIFSVNGNDASATVAHGLGGNGSAGNGTIALAPASFAGGGQGSAFTLTLTNVNNAACPGLASVMQRVSDIISVEGEGGPVVVKDSSASPPKDYDAMLAQAQCARGDANTFVFTAR
jgi:prepilin-type N-terminal cleavage/methylation domain-containing protein